MAGYLIEIQQNKTRKGVNKEKGRLLHRPHFSMLND